MNRSLLKVLTLGAAIAALPAGARAEPAATAAEPGKLEDVVVTAERREESAQRIGLAISVLSPSTLTEAGVDKVNGLANLTPSLEVEPAFSSGQPQYRLRGVGFIDYTSNNTAAVGVNVDEVPLPFPIQTQGQLFDIARVEVLRGPQGTLYGLNTTGGAVNFITNGPTADTQAGVSADFGSYDALRAEGYVSGSLGGDFTGRLSLATEQGGAWQRNRLTGQSLGDKDKIAGRAQIEWAPSATTRVRLTVHSATDQSDAYGTQLIAPFPSPGGAPVIPADTNPHLTGWSLSPTFAAFAGIAPDAKPGVDNANNGANLKINTDLGGARFTSITAYDKFTRREFNDWDATQYLESDVFFHDDLSVFSQEVRLASTGAGPLGWLVGAFYADDKLEEHFFGDFTQIYGASAVTSYRQNSKTYGAFGQVSYQFTDQLKGTLGLRPNRETRDLIDLVTIFGGGVYPPGPESKSISNDSLSGKAELDFAVNPGTLLYGSVSRGVKSGGFTAHNLTSDDPPFKPETLLAYELGIKADVTRSLRVNASAFYYDYRDQQVLSKFLTVTGYIGSFINAPKSHIEGGEVELTWEPGNGFELTQYAGYKTGKFDATVTNSSDVDFNGKDIDFPKTSYGGTVAYGWPVGGLWLRAAANYSYHDKYDQLFLLENVDASAHVIGQPQFQIDSYWLANASLELSAAPNGRWAVSLWAHNLTNQKYYLTKNFFLPNDNIGAAGEPTTIGIHLDWKL